MFFVRLGYPFIRKAINNARKVQIFKNFNNNNNFYCMSVLHKSEMFVLRKQGLK